MTTDIAILHGILLVGLFGCFGLIHLISTTTRQVVDQLLLKLKDKDGLISADAKNLIKAILFETSFLIFQILKIVNAYIILDLLAKIFKDVLGEIPAAYKVFVAFFFAAIVVMFGAVVIESLFNLINFLWALLRKTSRVVEREWGM